MVGGVLVEKDLETVKKDLDAQIINVSSSYIFYLFFKLNPNLF